MDIESKRYRVRSIGGGQLELIAKLSGRTHYCPASRLASAHQLADMSEWNFDRAIAKEMS